MRGNEGRKRLQKRQRKREKKKRKRKKLEVTLRRVGECEGK